MKTIFSKTLVFVVTAALLISLSTNAQEATAEEVVEDLAQVIEAVEDVRFTVSGMLMVPDVIDIDFELEVEAIFDMNLARITFTQPQDLAGNIVVLDGDTLHNYVTETNETLTFDARADTFGSLFLMFDVAPESPITINLDRLLEGWTATSAEPEDSNGTQVIRFLNENEAVYISEIDAVFAIDNGERILQELTLSTGGEIVSHMTFSNFEINSGLNPEDMRALPEEAEND